MRSPGGLSRLEERGEWKSEEVIHKAPRTRGEEGKSKRSSKCLSISRNMNNLLAPKKNIFRTSFFVLFLVKVIILKSTIIMTMKITMMEQDQDQDRDDETNLA